MPATKAGDSEISGGSCLRLSFSHAVTARQTWAASTVAAASMATFTEV